MKNHSRNNEARQIQFIAVVQEEDRQPLFVSFVNHRIDVPPFTCDTRVFFGDYSGISAHNGRVVPIFMHFDADKKLAVSVALFHFKTGTQDLRD